MGDTIATALVMSVAIGAWAYYKARALPYVHQRWLFEKQKEAAEGLNHLTSALIQNAESGSEIVHLPGCEHHKEGVVVETEDNGLSGPYV